MANVQLFPLARMTVASSGVSTITLNAAVSGFNTFDLAGCSTAATGQTLTYSINDTTQSEIGTGVYYSSGPFLTRGSSTVDLKSTNVNSPINMSNAAQVFITPSALNLGLTGQIPGTQTNDNASAGNIGEIVVSEVLSGAAVTLTSGAVANVTSMTITAGDWDVSGNVVLQPSSALTLSWVWVSSASATPPDRPNAGGMFELNLASLTGYTAGLIQTLTTGTKRQSVTSASTTIYLGARCTFGSSAVAYGYLRARRMR